MENKESLRTVAVSVIIPVYNVADWLDECMESVVNQTFSDFEVLLIDDGSTDISGKMCDEWAERDSRIRVIHKKNEGLSAARNDGIMAARGEYVVFLDSDDWWNLHFLEKLYCAAKSHQADMAECDIWRVNSLTGKTTCRKVAGVIGKENTLMEQLKYGHTAIWKCLIKRSLFIDHSLRFSNCHSPARPIYPLLLCLSKGWTYVQEPLYYYRLYREGSLSAIPRKETTTEGIQACEILINDIRKHGLDELFDDVLQQMIIVNLSDLSAAFFTQRQSERFTTLMSEYRKFITENFSEYHDRSYLTVGGYNLDRILSSMNLLHDPSGRFNFSSLISIMHSVEAKVVFRHKNRYRQMMLEREMNNQFWRLMEERKPDFVVLDFIEERFDMVAYQGGYLTRSDAFEGCENKPEAGDVILRDSDECMELWKESALAFIERMERDYPDTDIVLVKNYLAEKKGDIYSQEYFAELDEIRKINGILEQYYSFFRKHCKKVKVVEASKCQYYFTDKEYEYGVMPSHLNELVNREIAKMVEECVGI
ncbi:MAG: glycosyltransferase family 2 protein [Lachnospiraceae bacterium]|jgi:glycosyltransferase involved in cell wall biosynthesis|nr:glycosyltransferase family 2 protein [Lachnospiraceae bacterium]